MNLSLSTMSAAELRTLQDKVKQELKRREAEEMSKARDEIMRIAQSVGIPLKDLISGGMALRTKAPSTVAVRFRHPDDASKAWTGRGRQPRWVREWVDGGKSLDALRV